MRLIRPDGVEVFLGSKLDQVYSMQDSDGTQYHWAVAEAKRRALTGGTYEVICLSEIGITCDFIRNQYPDLDEKYAMTTDLTTPLLFVPFQGKHQLIDGWHRLFKAAKIGADKIPAFILSQEDADACLILRFAPGEGIDFLQSEAMPA